MYKGPGKHRLGLCPGKKKGYGVPMTASATLTSAKMKLGKNTIFPIRLAEQNLLANT